MDISHQISQQINSVSSGGLQNIGITVVSIIIASMFQKAVSRLFSMVIKRNRCQYALQILAITPC